MSKPILNQPVIFSGEITRVDADRAGWGEDPAFGTFDIPMPDGYDVGSYYACHDNTDAPDADPRANAVATLLHQSGRSIYFMWLSRDGDDWQLLHKEEFHKDAN